MLNFVHMNLDIRQRLCECFEVCLWQLHYQMHSLHQTKMHHTHKNIAPLLHWPNAVL